MHLKNHKGFTLLETVIALAVASIVLIPLFVLQGTMLERVSQASTQLQRLFFAKDFLYQSCKENQTEKSTADTVKKDKNNDDPKTVIQYNKQKPLSKSLFKEYDGLMSESVGYTWQWQGKDYTDTLITFTFKLPSE